jgi:hypothetical protein
MPKARKKLVRVVDGSDFARVFLRYGIERLVEEGHYSAGEISSLDNGGEYTRKLLSDKAFRRRLEAVEKKGA